MDAQCTHGGAPRYTEIWETSLVEQYEEGDCLICCIVHGMSIGEIYGMFGWMEEGGRVEGSRVEFAKNKLILC